MKLPVMIALVSVLVLVGCTTGSATRTSKEVYQPADSAAVEILFEKPSRPYHVIGAGGSDSSAWASDDAVYRALQKEAAELGAHAILMSMDIQHKDTLSEGYKKARALAIRWSDKKAGDKKFSVTPTSEKPTTPAAEQIIPKK